MKQLLTILFAFITIFCVSCNRNKSVNDDIIVAKDGSKSKKVIKEHNPDDSPKVVYYYKLDKEGNLTQEITREEHFYSGGKKYVAGDIKNGLKNGEWFTYFENGAIQTSRIYENGLEQGEFKVLRENGKPYYTGQYDKGICVGAWKWYDENGKVTNTVMAEGNNLACKDCPRCWKIKLNQ